MPADKKKIQTKSKAATRAKSRRKASPDSSPKRTGSAGRPPRLSRRMVLEASMELLEKGPVEQFTMARVAKSLDTVSMALYNYFPSRNALLEAIGDHVCMQFEMPPPKRNQTWQDTLMQWLWAFKEHAERYPIILKVMGVDGKNSPGWLRITLTVSKTLYEQGMRDHQLALHVWLFCSYAVAIVFNEIEGSVFRTGYSLADLDKLDPDEQEFLLMMRKHNITLSSDEVLELAFGQIIGNLEREIEALQKT